MKREKLAGTIVCQEVGEIADCSKASINDTAPPRHCQKFCDLCEGEGVGEWRVGREGRKRNLEGA